MNAPSESPLLEAMLAVTVGDGDALEIKLERSLDFEDLDDDTVMLELSALGGRRFQFTGTGQHSACFEIAPELLDPLAQAFAKAVALARTVGVLQPAREAS